MKDGLPDPNVRVKILDRCDYLFAETVSGGMRVVTLPPELLRHFNEGYHAIRINSIETAISLPDFGGGTAIGGSQIPHQDHSPADPRRFLAFSKTDTKARGSETYLAHPIIVEEILPAVLRVFRARREEIKAAFVPKPPYMIPEHELMHCFEPNGLDAVARAHLGANSTPQMRLFVYMGLLTYVLQGTVGDELVKWFLFLYSEEVVRESWETPGTLIVDNSRIFHGRLGPNVRLKRNWIIEPA